MMLNTKHNYVIFDGLLIIIVISNQHALYMLKYTSLSLLKTLYFIVSDSCQYLFVNSMVRQN